MIKRGCPLTACFDRLTYRCTRHTAQPGGNTPFAVCAYGADK